MEDNVYSAPEAKLIDGSNTDEVGQHYIIPQAKLWAFSLLSFGIFLLPWNYMHWRRVKVNEDSDIWPAPRSLFSIFFINSLFTKFETSKIDSGAEHAWSPSANAVAYIIFSIIANILDRIYELTTTEINAVYWVLTLSALIIPILTISNAQRTVNIACGDPSGDSNRKWTLGNYLWIALLLVFWGLAIFGTIYADAGI